MKPTFLHVITSFLFLILLSPSLLGQDSLQINYKTIGVEYFGELGLHPGARVDIGLPLWTNTKLKGKNGRKFYQKLIARPHIGYYYIPQYTNNFFFGSDISLQFLTQKTNTKKYFIFESFFGLRYLRYSYQGSIYASNTNGGFDRLKNGGGNSFVFSSGFLIGGSLPVEHLEWILGAEYFGEFSEDKLIVHHPAARVGLRFKW